MERSAHECQDACSDRHRRRVRPRTHYRGGPGCAGIPRRRVDLALPASDAARQPGIEYVTANITRADEVERAIEIADSTGQIQVVVNCAGIAPSARILTRGDRHDLELFARVTGINLIGTFNVMALAARSMANSEPKQDGLRGVIVNTASIAAFDGQIGQTAYAASKGGVAELTLPAARDLARYGIRACTIAPGIINTPMMAAFPAEVQDALAAGVPLPQRLGRPEEYARLVLAIVDNDYLNGEVIRLDGALRMAPR